MIIHAVSSSYNNVSPNVLCKYIHTSLSKRSFNWGDPTPKHQEWTVSHNGGPRMSIWPILTDNKHPLNFPGTFGTSCIHSPLSLLNYQVIKLKSLRCSSLPRNRFSLKRKPIQRTEPGDGEKRHFPERVHSWIQLCLKSVLLRTLPTQWKRENQFLSCTTEES